MQKMLRVSVGVMWCSNAVVVLLLSPTAVTASIGDRSDLFQQCLFARYRQDCYKNMMADRELQKTANSGLARYLMAPIYVIGLGPWSCLDQLKYTCMWMTVDAHIKSGQRVPQFYGKWPFVRFLGMQEPASVVFSVLNGATNYAMWKAFRAKVSRSAPTYYVWNGYALVSMNAWFWSTVFHAHDTAITEMLDYFSATSCVLYSFYGLCARILFRHSKAGVTLCAIACCSFFVMHVHYLAFVNFDYGYNMKASVSIGLLNSLGWLVWCATRWHRQEYVWKCAAVVSSVTVLLLLEVTDFPPIWWTFDAHSLWHLGTIPLPLLWYSFLIDDCHYMLSEKKLEKSV